MTNTKIKDNQISTHNANDNQLCFLMYEGMHYRQREAYRQLVQDAQHRCQQCGRTAKSDQNLCTPVAL